MPSHLPPWSPPVPQAIFIFGEDLRHFTFLFSGLTPKSTETFRRESVVILIRAGGGKKCVIVVSQVLVSCFQLLLKPESACYSSVGNYTQRHTPQAKTAAAQTAHTEISRWIVGGRLKIFTAVRVSVCVCVCARACLCVFSKAPLTTGTSAAALANPLILVHLNLTTHASIFSQSCDWQDGADSNYRRYNTGCRCTWVQIGLSNYWRSEKCPLKSFQSQKSNSRCNYCFYNLHLLGKQFEQSYGFWMFPSVVIVIKLTLMGLSPVLRELLSQKPLCQKYW